MLLSLIPSSFFFFLPLLFLFFFSLPLCSPLPIPPGNTSAAQLEFSHYEEEILLQGILIWEYFGFRSHLSSFALQECVFVNFWACYKTFLSPSLKLLRMSGLKQISTGSYLFLCMNLWDRCPEPYHGKICSEMERKKLTTSVSLLPSDVLVREAYSYSCTE